MMIIGIASVGVGSCRPCGCQPLALRIGRWAMVLGARFCARLGPGMFPLGSQACLGAVRPFAVDEVVFVCLSVAPSP